MFVKLVSPGHVSGRPSDRKKNMLLVLTTAIRAEKLQVQKEVVVWKPHVCSSTALQMFGVSRIKGIFVNASLILHRQVHVRLHPTVTY